MHINKLQAGPKPGPEACSLKDTLFAKAVRYSVLRVHPQKKETVGVDDGEVPPVPIPNTEVKLTRAEDSWLETACENR